MPSLGFVDVDPRTLRVPPQYAPGVKVRVEIVGRLKASFGHLPTIGDLLP